MTTSVQAIIDYLQSRASDTALTPEQINLLVAELKAQINQLSVTVPDAQPGAVTLLYSGLLGDGLHSGDVAQAIATANPGQVLTINQTDVGNLLSSDSFEKALQAALGPKSEIRNQIYDSIINGSKDANGIRVADSL